jgi:hypothetical protein
LIELTPDPVIRAARSLSDQQSGSHSKIKLDDAQAAGTPHPGWAASAANGPCVQAWRQHLHSLGKTAAEAADALTRTMDDYVSTNESVADQMRSDAAWLGDA